MSLAWTASAWIGGTVAAALIGAGAWPVGIALAATLLALALARRDRRVAVYALVLPAVFVAGLVRFATYDVSIADDDVAHFAGGPAMRIRGVLRVDPVTGDTTQRFAISVREVQRAGGWQPASGGVQIWTGLLPRFESGDVVEIEGRLELPPKNEGFDYAEYLGHRGIHSTLAFPAIRVVGHDDDNVLRAAVLNVRRRLAHGLALALPEPQASLAQGVLLGQRSALPRDLNDDLNATNTSHLVVVSGANVVLVSAFAAGLLTWAFGRRRALLLSVVVVLAYMLLVGASPPVVRGTIMGILLVLAQVTGRRTNGLISVTFAAAVMIGVQPSAVRDVSFQLSFAATAGIVFLAGPLHDWLIEWLARLFRREAMPRAVSAFLVLPLATTIAAIVATEPLIALNFGRISLVAVPANMLVVPVFGLVLASSALAALGGLIPHAHLLFAAPAYFLLTYWITIAGGLSSIPFSSMTFGGYSSPWAFISYVAITLVSFTALRRFGRPPPRPSSESVDWRRLAPVAAVVVPIAALVGSAGILLRPAEPARLEVTIVDVGQGDAILIEAPDGQDILVDGGPGGEVLRGLGRELNWRDRSIELLVLTHPQADHVVGLLDVLDRYDVQRVIAAPGQTESIGYETWLAAVRAEGLDLEYPEQGASFDLGRGARIDVLGPAEDMGPDQLNNTSLVLRLVWGDVSFLLTGDIEADAELALVASGVELQSTVLKVAHHGSRTSSSATFLAAVRPSISVVSAGQDNPFGHPHEEVARRLGRWGQVFVTAESGSVHFETDGTRLWISTRGQ